MKNGLALLAFEICHIVLKESVRRNLHTNEKFYKFSTFTICAISKYIWTAIFYVWKYNIYVWKYPCLRFTTYQASLMYCHVQLQGETK